MKAYADAPRLLCGECGSQLLIQRPRGSWCPVRCLNAHCAEKDIPYAYQLVEVELNLVPVETPI